MWVGRTCVSKEHMSSFSIALQCETPVTVFCVTSLYFLIRINPFCSSSDLFHSLSSPLSFSHMGLIRYASGYLSSILYICSRTAFVWLLKTSLNYIHLVLFGWSSCIPVIHAVLLMSFNVFILCLDLGPRF